MLIKPKSKKFWTYSPSWGAAASAPPPTTPSYTFLTAHDVTASSGTTETFSITMNGTSGRLIFALTEQNLAATSVVYDPTGANITLTQDFLGSTTFGFYSANIPAATGSKNIVATFPSSVGFQGASGIAWVADNLTTGFVAGAASSGPGGPATIAVAANEFLFAAVSTPGGVLTPGTFSGSTSAPSFNRASTPVGSSSQLSASADWASPTVSGSFSVVSGATGTGNVATWAATYK
jgi:hypothetical protein